MTWRRRIRHAIDLGARGAGVLSRRERGMRRGVTALTYHRVLPDEGCAGYPFPSLVVPLSAFRAQVRWLAANAELRPAAGWFGADAAPAGADGLPPVCLTFDDGYADNAELAAPVLEEHGVRASFYVTTAFVETGWTWFDRAAGFWSLGATRCREVAGEEPAGSDAWMALLKAARPDRRRTILDRLGEEIDLESLRGRFRPMSRAQVRELADRGHEIGNHTVSHPILPQLAPEDAAREISDARSALRDWTNSDVTGFCYPNGDADAAVADGVRQAGHEYAFTTAPGVADPSRHRFLLPRRMVSPGGSAGPGGGHSDVAFRAEISGFHDDLRRML